MAEIKQVAVIGAGVMGAGIAAHIANAGVPVLLLDILPKEGENRNAIAERAIEALFKADPAPLMHKRNAKLIRPGNTEDDLKALAECDWIIEAVIERQDIKSELYARIDAVRKPGSIVSSNTSTILLEQLVKGQSEQFQRDFLISHFFNPPRYMRLFELVSGPQTSAQAVAAITRFADVSLGKSVVPAKDRPGFIANRLGVFWLQAGVTEAFEAELTVEEADAVIGRSFGIPKTGVFGLIDLVGLDLMPYVMGSMMRSLPREDALHAIYRDQPLVTRMIADGYTGRKGKGGFYRLNRAGGGKVKEAIDLGSGDYRAQRKAELEILAATKGDLRALFSSEDVAGRYAWRVMGQTLSYAASLVGDAADDLVAIDEAMRLGYNWKYGPFELIDKVGAGWLAQKLATSGWQVPAFLRLAGERSFYRVENGKRQYLGLEGDYHDVVRPEGVLLLEDIKRTAKPVIKNGSASLWDIGDGVACFEFTSKMNSLDPDVMSLLGKAVAVVEKQFKALVVYNEGENFSVGANLALALFAANIAVWPEIEQMLVQGQETYRALKYAKFPVIGAPAGLALGGGCEILLHCDALQAHAETYVGLVEAGVGLVPAWGGCKEMLARWASNPHLPRGPIPPVAQVFETVSVATVAKSAAEARDLMYLRPHDRVTMNRYRLLADAKAFALELAENYAPPEPPVFTPPGPTGKVALGIAVESFAKRGLATPHDQVVATALAAVLSGDEADTTVPVDETQLLALERRHFMTLVKNQASLARIESMLETGKPLRN
jgi:3-hydroxyacyl-CoA dehydrogenase